MIDRFRRWLYEPDEELAEHLREPLTFRTLSINFPSRTITIDGTTHTIEADSVAIPILSTEHPVIPGGRRW
jgi:hypothetical protein